MPRLWERTIESHRGAVREAVIDTTARLVAERGLAAVSMSQVAEEAGIGRATLYRYFPDVESILHAWHGRQIEAHLARLAHVRDTARPDQRLEAVLTAYALLALGSRDHADRELAALLHRDERVAHAQRRVADLVRELVADAAQAGAVRSDVPPDELARFALHALTAASGLRSRRAVERLVAVTLAGLRG